MTNVILNDEELSTIVGGRKKFRGDW